MAERIQLKEPGTHVEFFVAGVKPETIERNDYYLFINAVAMGGAKELLVPQSSVKAQMERLDITAVEQMIGRNVRFGRSTKMSRANKPYWDIDWAEPSKNGSGAEQSAGGGLAANTSVGAPSVEPVKKPTMREAYASLTRWVISDILPLYDAVYTEGTCSPDVVAACVQTLFIQACKSGKVE